MIICLSGFVIGGAPVPAAPASLEPRVAAVRPLSALTHNAVQVKSYYDGPLGARKPQQPLHPHARGYSPPPSAGGAGVARYSPHHHHILHQFGGSAHALTHHDAHSTLLNSTSSSAESVSSVSSRDPPLPAPAAPPAPPSPVKTRRAPPHHVYYATGYRPQHNHSLRVRTLYACLGESEGELSFEPNQIITNVKTSAEPGWLEGTLNGRTGLVPENYVEALP